MAASELVACGRSKPSGHPGTPVPDGKAAGKANETPEEVPLSDRSLSTCQSMESRTAERTKLLGNSEDREETLDSREDSADPRPEACHGTAPGSQCPAGFLSPRGQCPGDGPARPSWLVQGLLCGTGVGVALGIVATCAILGNAAFRTSSQGSTSLRWYGSRENSVVPPPPTTSADGGLCNASAPWFFPEPLRSWRLAPLWRRACEAKSHATSPLQRNWCWVGWKSRCHANLKAHHSWERLQELASQEGKVPPLPYATFQPLENPRVCDRPEFGKARSFTAAETAEARRWLKDNVAVYVLNLPADSERWAMISKRLQSLEIWATRISGVDMRVPGALTKAKRMGWVPQAFNFTQAQLLAYQPEQGVGSILGTLGCASAHFKVQQRLLAEGSPLGLVMEDDSWPEDDFIQRLWSLVKEELPCDWEVLALMSRCPYGKCVSRHLSRVQPDGNEPAWRCRHGVNWGMHAVLYRTETLPAVQDLWKRTVFDEKRPHCLDVDVALASISDKVAFYAVPAVQDPGFLRETNHRSARWSINQAARTTVTVTTTSFIYVPTVRPGEPWPGAWKFG